MKVIILAGGAGTRLSEETESKPKPMIEIGDHPMLWHITKHFAHYGFKEFVIALGYKGDVIKRFFLDYQSLNGSMTIDLSSGHVARHSVDCEGWTVHLIDTGVPTNTGGRVKRLEPWLKGETFLLTYGDGLCDIDYQELLRFHRSHGRIATVTAVRPPSRFGGLIFNGDLVTEFVEKPQVGEGWINGGFMVLEPGIFDYLDNDTDSLEAGALERLAQDGQLAAYRHDSFWQCMDTLRDKRYLEGLWRDNQAPWRIWE
ncbi:MAG: glucose-phosphate cytidylyltransferase [Blastocatellia bacterium]|jgi:glucose-1-phosphate cytidylyltransferase|nr:glucose-phosphate cytidylyltransferase [Blastocatellia bacterium]